MSKKVINILRIIIAIIFLILLFVVFYKAFAGKILNNKDEDTQNQNAALNDESTELDESEYFELKEVEKKNNEKTYKEINFADSWYDENIYRPLCKTLDDDYFDKICFFGDSRTKGLLEYSGIPTYHGFYKVGTTAAAACVEREYTIDNYYYKNILEIIENVDYDIYYIAYGTNDLGLGSSEKFIEDMKVIINHIKEYHPYAIIYVENILPMSESFSLNHPTFSNEHALEYNNALLDMCKEYRDVIYLDTASCVKKYDNSAMDEYIADGLHYNAEGYKLIIDFIKKTAVEKIDPDYKFSAETETEESTNN